MTRGKGIYDDETKSEDAKVADSADDGGVSDKDTPDVEKEHGEPTA